MVQARDRIEHLTLRPYQCGHCGHVLGTMTDNILYVGMGVWRKLTTFDCAHCEKTVRWCPKNESTKNSK